MTKPTVYPLPGQYVVGLKRLHYRRFLIWTLVMGAGLTVCGLVAVILGRPALAGLVAGVTCSLLTLAYYLEHGRSVRAFHPVSGSWKYLVKLAWLTGAVIGLARVMAPLHLRPTAGHWTAIAIGAGLWWVASHMVAYLWGMAEVPEYHRTAPTTTAWAHGVIPATVAISGTGLAIAIWQYAYGSVPTVPWTPLLVGLAALSAAWSMAVIHDLIVTDGDARTLPTRVVAFNWTYRYPAAGR